METLQLAGFESGTSLMVWSDIYLSRKESKDSLLKTSKKSEVHDGTKVLAGQSFRRKPVPIIAVSWAKKISSQFGH
jgi:hypothetical protein